MKNVEIVNVSACGITDEGAIEICKEFKQAKRLRTVNLSNNVITKESIEAKISLIVSR